MPFFYCRSKLSYDTTQLLFAKIPDSKAQFLCQNEGEEGESSDLSAAKANYQKLPDYLKSCLDYCCLVWHVPSLHRKKLVRVMLAEGLVEEKPGELMEDTAENMLQELDSVFNHSGIRRVSELCQEVCLYEVAELDFVNEVKNLDLATHVAIKCEGNYLPAIDFKGLLIRSLFVTVSSREFEFNQAFMKSVYALQFMVVLMFQGGKVECLADEVGDLVDLRYLGLSYCQIENKKLPGTIGNLQKLQTLDIRFSNTRQLPPEILNIRQLRYLDMEGSRRSRSFVRNPDGFGNLVNLQSWYGVQSGYGIASGLSNLTQLRELRVGRVSDGYATELSAAIMKMEKLVTLSLEADYDESRREYDTLPEWESFSPPTHLQQLRLHGGLVEIPNWLSYIQNLTDLQLYNSNLPENPSTVLQLLPKLKHLVLWEAFKAKLIGKELCDEGGFPMLQTLEISSSYLVEWSDITKGAFPSLRSLHFVSCYKLRFLPEGLQHISTLQWLSFTDLHGDLARRLKGQENYKIKHIPNFRVENEF